MGLSLDRVYPNPARDDVSIQYVLPGMGEATIELLDLAGRRVLERSIGSPGAGTHTLSLAGAKGTRPAGVYFLRLKQGGQSVTRRVVFSNER